MKERPILFSAPMVRALLDGSKTLTRRVVKLPRGYSGPDAMSSWTDINVIDGIPVWLVRRTEDIKGPNFKWVPSPYGHPGDRLWVRETWADVGTMDPGLIVYRADYPACVPKEYQNVPPVESITWKPSIHMFREYSRIALEITGVRVERLQDISEEDAYAEGISAEDVVCSRCHGRSFHMQGGDSVDCEAPGCGRSAADEYRDLWESINGVGSWDANPWVWVIEFESGIRRLRR